MLLRRLQRWPIFFVTICNYGIMISFVLQWEPTRWEIIFLGARQEVPHRLQLFLVMVLRYFSSPSWGPESSGEMPNHREFETKYQREAGMHLGKNHSLTSVKMLYFYVMSAQILKNQRVKRSSLDSQSMRTLQAAQHTSKKYILDSRLVYKPG